MTRPNFLLRPGAWTRTARTGQSPADYACAVQRSIPTPMRAADLVIAALAVATLAAIALGWI